MKQKLFILFLALITCAETIWASGILVNGIWYNYNTGSKTASVTFRGSTCTAYKNEYNGDLTIPSSIEINGISYSVTSIGSEAFYDCPDLTSVVIPSSITSIGDRAFCKCSGLSSVNLPNSVTSIGLGAFSSCSSLDFPIYNVHIFAHLPTSCANEYTIPEGIEIIAGAAFSNCVNLTSITIPNSITSIGENAFRDCSGLTSVTIPNSVINIGRGAFYGCLNLPVIDNIRYADTYLIQVVDKTLSSYTIREGTKWMCFNAFKECTNLTSIILPNSIVSIEDRVFSNCSRLLDITIKTEIPPILMDENAFESCPANIYVPCGTKNAYCFATNWQTYNSRIKYAPILYTITIDPSDFGMVYTPLTICDSLLTAVANYGYHFVQWSDGLTDNPRTIVLTQDTSFSAEFARNTYLVQTESSNLEWGITYGDTSALYMEQVEISASVLQYGYHFVSWEDGVIDNPRIVTITGDKTYKAIFAKNVYNITKQYDNTRGQVNGPSQAEYLDIISLSAHPNFGYQFTQWSDGVIDNPRSFVITQDTTFTAEFAISTTGQCGDNLYWSYQENKLSFSGSGDMYNYTSSSVPWKLFLSDIKEVVFINGMTSIGNYACENMTNLEYINIPASVQTIGDYAFANINNRKVSNLVLTSNIVSIGDYAFAGNTYIEQIDFGKSIESIGAYAFQNCTRVTTMTCLAEVTPEVGADALTSISNYAELYVLGSALRKYQVDENWNRFLLKELGATDVPTTSGVVIEPTDNTVTITWPTSAGAETYTIEITKDGDVFCTLIFNATGQLTGIAFAPSRMETHNMPVALQTADGMQFTITGLNSGTSYAYNLTSKNNSGTVIALYSGQFSTTGSPQDASALDETNATSAPCKILRNGQIVILRGDKTYTLQGIELK